MMERYDHNNPWADKLQDIPLPEENVSWEAMEAVLDREMPVNKRGDRRRWVLLIILLLLLIGVCNCPGRRVAGDREGAGWKRDVDSGIGGKRDTRKRTETKMADKRGGGTDTVNRPVGTLEPRGGSDTGNEKDIKEGLDWTDKVVANPVGRGSVGRRGSKGGRGKLDSQGPKDARVMTDVHRMKDGSGMVGDATLVDRKPGTVNEAGTGRTSARKDTVASKQMHTDSTATVGKKPAVDKKPKADSILQMKGWLAGIGLNQFFTLGRQQQSNYNSSGTTGGVSDYIPVPMVRYYFSRKLYVQLEAQFNTPQYTTKNLLASLSKPDSATIPGQVLQTSLYIKKLFYFNLPLSIHYSPVPNLYIGGGIQYARLTNGVALYQDSGHSIFLGGADSLRSSKIKSFRNDPVYSKLKTNEFRLLLDLNYNFKRFVIGGRYNRALSDFINLQLFNNQVTQSRNSSFQVYLRYIIWDGRKKILLPK